MSEYAAYALVFGAGFWLGHVLTVIEGRRG